MILLNIYGKIDPIMILEKLNIGLSNSDEEMVESFLDIFEKEMLIREILGKGSFNNILKREKRDFKEIVKRLHWEDESKDDKN